MRTTWTFSSAGRIIFEGRGTHFDPDLVDAFVAIAEEFRAIAVKFADADTHRDT